LGGAVARRAPHPSPGGPATPVREAAGLARAAYLFVHLAAILTASAALLYTQARLLVALVAAATFSWL
jgi:hypothetical protein